MDGGSSSPASLLFSMSVGLFFLDSLLFLSHWSKNLAGVILKSRLLPVFAAGDWLSLVLSSVSSSIALVQED